MWDLVRQGSLRNGCLVPMDGCSVDNYAGIIRLSRQLSCSRRYYTSIWESPKKEAKAESNVEAYDLMLF